MSSQIWKFSIPDLGRCAIEMPAGAKLLDVQIQRGLMQLWALVDDDAPKVQRELFIAGTGHPFNRPRICRHVATVQDNGGFVWHVFDLGEQSANPTTPEPTP